jgi:transposase
MRQEQLWTPTDALPVSASHPFYQKLNQVLDERRFDEVVERMCERFYAETLGRPGLVPGIYFRLLMVGYFEGIDSERGIAWRASDSLSIRSFVRIALDETVPDHSTISRTRRLMDVETHQAVFQWVPQVLAERNLLKGNTIGVDATTLEANAALRSIVRRDTGEQYHEFLTRLAKESGIQTPTREQLAKLDRKRKKKGSNEEWQHPQDPDARITKMKDGRTHLAHKAEHAVDMETGAIAYGLDMRTVELTVV